VASYESYHDGRLITQDLFDKWDDTQQYYLMYKFIFYVMYNHQIGKNKGSGFARFNGTLILSFEILLQIILSLSFLRKIFPGLEWTKYLNMFKFLVPVTFIVLQIVIFRFFNNEKNSVESKDERYQNTKSNKLFVFGAIVLPMVRIGWMAS